MAVAKQRKQKPDPIPTPIPYHEYFGKMYISPRQMKTRIDLAGEIEDVMIYVFAYWAIAGSAGITEEEVRQDAKDKLRLVLAKHTKLDSYLEKHIDRVVDEVIDTTKKNADLESPYWTSRERAMLIAENEANAFENYVEYREAATSGKTKKKWLTENDDKVRLSHELAEGQTVDIDGLFLIGDSLMRFPMDTMFDADPKETINCRCSCVYE
jgi:hypothetical protein